MAWQLHHPLALLFFLLVPLVALLHLVRRRPQPMAVPFLKLWERSEMRRGSGFRRLRQILPLILALSLLTALVLALAGPHVPAPAPEHVLLVIDDTASMEAVDMDGATRFEKARTAVSEALRRGPAHVEFGLATVTGAPLLRAPIGTDRLKIQEILRTLTPKMKAGDAAKAVNMLAPAVDSKASAQVWLATDTPARRLPTETPGSAPVHVVHLGDRGDNLRIAAVSGAWGGWWNDQASAFIAVENMSPLPATTRLRLNANRTPVIDREILLAGFERFETTTTVKREQEDTTLELAVEAGGALGCDDTAWCILPPVRRRRVVLVSDRPGPFLASALEGMEDLIDQARSVQVSVKDWRRAVTDEDLVIFEGAGPGSAFPEGGCLVIGAPAGAIPGEDGKGRSGPASVIDWDREHPVTQTLAFSSVYFGSLRPLPRAFHPLILTGSGTAAGCAEGPGGRAVVLGCPLSDTNLGLISTFPLFVRNALRWCGSDTTPDRNPGRCAYEDPTAGKRSGLIWLSGRPGGPGVAMGGGDKFVVNFFDRDESQLDTPVPGSPSFPLLTAKPDAFDPWRALAWAALFLALLDGVALWLRSRGKI